MHFQVFYQTYLRRFFPRCLAFWLIGWFLASLVSVNPRPVIIHLVDMGSAEQWAWTVLETFSVKISYLK